MDLSFSPSTLALLEQAEQRCTTRGAKLTELRRQVLGLVLESKEPAGAYDLLDRLRGARGPSAPPTVYRALEFLVEQGLIHRVERLAAFVGCIDDKSHSHGHTHAAQFLICSNCRRVIEIEDTAIAHALRLAAQAHNFAISSSMIEAEGLCSDCCGAP
jgi:Fur family zinc uptake transcriptional regulator